MNAHPKPGPDLQKQTSNFVISVLAPSGSIPISKLYQKNRAPNDSECTPKARPNTSQTNLKYFNVGFGTFGFKSDFVNMSKYDAHSKMSALPKLPQQIRHQFQIC